MSGCFVIPHCSITVLTIDSPAQHLAPLTQALKSYGYDLRLHTFLKVGLDLIQEVMPDLILINLQAIGSAGYKVCQTLRQIPAIQDTPVVFVGNSFSKAQSVLALQSGANEYLPWPLRLEESVLRLVNHLQQSLLIRQLRADNAGLNSVIRHHERTLQEQESDRLSLTQRNQELQRLAYIDGLTQVANRLGFNQHLSNLWSVLSSTRQPLALILCDVDYFKRYNDTYGHPAGDQCLQMVAEVLSQSARRPTDLVARYGGEEFAILLPGSTAQSAAQIAEDVQTALVRRQWPHRTSGVSPFVSLSVGVASVTPTSLTPSETLIRLADEALYGAKTQGRNQIIVANSSCRSGVSLASSSSVNHSVGRGLISNSDKASGVSVQAKCY